MANEITQETPRMNIFITGADSVVGRAATRLLTAAGHRVFGATTATNLGAKSVRADGGIPTYTDLFRSGELRSAMTAAEADVVINLAPLVANHVPQVSANWDEKLLVEGTAALIEAAIAADVKYLIHGSYIFAGGENALSDSLIDAARVGEQLALSGKMPGSVLRFGFLYGAESSELISLRDLMKIGRSVNGGQASSDSYWTYAGDAASAVLRAVQVQPVNVTLNVSDDHPTTPMAFLTYFAQSQGFALPSSRRAPTLRSLLGTPTADASAIHVDVNTAETKTTLGWAPRFVDYRQGIDDLLLSWRAAGV